MLAEVTFWFLKILSAMCTISVVAEIGSCVGNNATKDQNLSLLKLESLET